MSSFKLLPLDNSDLYSRRHDNKKYQLINAGYEHAFCSKCGDGFGSGEVFVKSDDRFFHNDCFRCAQCFELLHDHEYFTGDGRNYCSYDFKILYAPKCEQCEEFIQGVVMRASNGNWHPHCLTCTGCHKPLQTTEGIYIVNGSNYCATCKNSIAKEEHYICAKCHQSIDKNCLLRYKLEVYHPYHFTCVRCDKEVDETARVCGDDVYCLRCYDLEKSVTCFACKVAIDTQRERSVLALDRHYHPKCFACHVCNYPLHSVPHQVVRGQPTCEKCYVQINGNVCFMCGIIQKSHCVRIFSKVWCNECYMCSLCNKKLEAKSKIADIDFKPACKKCVEKLPKELRKRLFT
ncbi:hypothetical protein L596_005247 [Steinernema carpocapsae]|uniref:LIM zinc-binding domain-containing protein n=1 Tax=Steinernema carpocapsae TaxID=34508 RepID=A0A4U8V2M7_STECR|nr:hypothetical protein L596_005247 [Steinernema carpocapsae]